jgi:hypothetical protein
MLLNVHTAIYVVLLLKGTICKLLTVVKILETLYSELVRLQNYPIMTYQYGGCECKTLVFVHLFQHYFLLLLYQLLSSSQ